jgi:hypothetical protein
VVINVRQRNVIDAATRLVLMTLFASLLVACGSSAHVSAETEAQNVYLDAVRHRNDVLARIQAEPAPAWTDLRRLAAEMKQAEEEKLHKLEAGKWPAAAESAIAALEDETRSAIPYWMAAAAGGTADDVTSNIDLALKHCGGPAAGMVRSSLGLPPA